LPDAARPFLSRRQTGEVNLRKVNAMIHDTAVAISQPLQDLRPHLTAEIAIAEEGQPQSSNVPADDRQNVAARIRNLLGQANLTEKRVRIGGEFKGFYGRLCRTSRHDRSRTGWRAAFNDPNPFVFSRRIAERYIEIYEAFRDVGHVWPALPHAFRALHILATLKLSDGQLKSKCLSGEISPNTTEGQIYKLAAELGIVKTKPKEKPKSTGATIVPLNRLSPAEQKRQVGSLTPSALRAALSVEQHAALRARYEAQLARIDPKKAASMRIATEAEVPATRDLVVEWDAATPDQQKKLAQERGNKILDLATAV
jgi:hypothetical protein